MTIIISVVVVLLLISLLMVSVQNTINNRKKAIRKLELNREYLIKKITEYNSLIDRMIPENIEKKTLADELTKIKNEIYKQSNDIEVNILKNNVIYNATKSPSFNEEENKSVKDEYLKQYEKEYIEELKIERDEYNKLVEKFNNSIVSFPGILVSKLFKQSALLKFVDRLDNNKTNSNNSASHYNAEFNINQETIVSPTPKVEQESNLHMAHKVKPLESQVKIEVQPEIVETLDDNQTNEMLASQAINNANSTQEIKTNNEMPIIEQPTIEPVMEQPTIEPVMEQPTIEPVVEQPIIEPVVEQPTVEPVVEQPIIEPVKEQPTIELVVEQPIIEPVLEPKVENVQITETIPEPILPDPTNIINAIEESKPVTEEVKKEESKVIEEPKPVEIKKEESQKKTEPKKRFCSQCNTLTDELFCPNCGNKTE